VKIYPKYYLKPFLKKVLIDANQMSALFAVL